MMAALTAHPHPERSASPVIRRGVAATVLVVHALVVAAVLQQETLPPVQSGQTVMVSFVSEEAQEQAVESPPAPTTPAEAPPVLATERQVVSEAAPILTEPAPALAASPAAVVQPAADVAAPPHSDAVPAALPPSVLTPPSFGAAYLNNPRPVYPLASKRLQEQGVTLLRVLVGADGRPQDIQIEQGSGFDRLDRAARMAVRDWRFVPARAGDKAVSGWVTVPINWKLEN